MQHLTFWVGIALAVIGCLILVYGKESAAANELELLKMKFKLSHPSLVLIVLGIVLIVRGDDNAPQPSIREEKKTAPANPGTDAPAAADSAAPYAEAAAPGATPPEASAPATNTAAPAADAATPVEDAATSAALAAAPAANAATPAEDAATSAAHAAASAAEAPPPLSPVWVYLGTASGNSLQSKNFSLTQLPVAGQAIEALTDVNERSTAPMFKEDNQWHLGSTIGFVRRGERVSVRRLETFKSTKQGSEFVWAEVDVSPKTAR